MRSMVFNSPLVAFWFAISGAIVFGAMLATFIGLCFKNCIIRKEVERRIPEITEEYKTELAGAELIISQNRSLIERYERIQAEIVLSANRMITAVGSK